MPKFYKIIITIFLFLVIGLIIFGGVLYLRKTNFIENFVAKNLPNLSELGTVNLPGKLLGPKASSRAENLDAHKIIEWTNYYRQQEGLAELASNQILAQAAQTKINDMFQKQYFEHVSPTGVSPDQLVLSAGYNYKVTGENLALGDFKDEKELVDAWMGSPGHRANILNPDYTEIGVASGLDEFEDRSTTWISVQEFGRPAPQCASPDQTLAQQIETKKAEYDRLKLEYDALLSDNKKLTQEQYQEAIALQDELNSLYYAINNLVNQYNVQVNSYNYCIKQ